MKKELIEAAAVRLARAVESFYKITDAFTVDTMKGYEITAQINLKPFEEAFPNRGLLIARGHYGQEFPYQKELVVGGVKFFCLLTKEEKEKRDE